MKSLDERQRRTLYKQRGETTRQLLALPKNGVFVTRYRTHDYIKKLAQHLGRDDIEIVKTDWLTSKQFVGRRFTGIDMDHDCVVKCSPREWQALRLAETRVKS